MNKFLLYINEILTSLDIPNINSSYEKSKNSHSRKRSSISKLSENK